ncbi:MAG: fibronectin type III domain-containing protein [Lachnospiraceae bacterium]|nr:fibronectin type III domain-containing protein [Lachnospiraceae bacterium]
MNLKLTDKPYKGLTFRSERYRIVDPADYTDLSSATVKVTPSSKYYTGEALAPDSVTVSVGNTVLAKDSAYTLVYKDASGNTIDPNNMKEVGQYTLQIDGITDNGFCGEQTATFTIKPVKTLSDDNIAVSPYKLKYTGSRRVPTVTVTYTENGNTTTLRQGSDYSLSYANAKTGAAVSSPTAVGQYYAVVTAITNSGYVGGGRRGFEIVDVAKDLVLELDSTETTYDGKAHVPTVKSVKDAAGNVVPSGTYTVAITNASGKTVTSPTNAGEYKVTASVDNLNSDYYGRSGSASYIIRKYNITDAKVSIEGISRNYDYTGSAIRPDLRLTFETTDSTASLDSSGRQSMLAAIDRLTGTMTVKAADGTTTTLVKGKDYTISAYNNNVKVGQASVIIEGKGNFTDSVEKYYKIVAPTISGLVATPVNSSKIRVSWNKTPNATKYQISYKNGDKDVSKTTKGTVINADELKSDTAVQFAVRAYVKDRYTDAKTVTAKTTKATSSGSSSGTSSSTSSNTSTSSSTTSYVYRSSSDDDDDDDKSSSSYTKAKTPKAKNVKVSSPKKGRAKIKWKDNYTYDGVEVFRSTDGVKYYKVARMVTKNSYTNKNLTSGQTYYYKVRAFSYKGSKKKNAKMSAAKAVTVQ